MPTAKKSKTPFKRPPIVTRSIARNQPFRFLDLSAEMRNTIYEYAYTAEGGEIVINIEGDTYRRQPEATKNPFALAYSCKQIWGESSALAYSLNTFRFLVGSNSQVLGVAARIERSPNRISRIMIDFDELRDNNFPQLQALRKIHKTGIDLRLVFRPHKSPEHEPTWDVRLSDPESAASQMSVHINYAISTQHLVDHPLVDLSARQVLRSRVLRILWPAWAVHNGH